MGFSFSTNIWSALLKLVKVTGFEAVGFIVVDVFIVSLKTSIKSSMKKHKKTWKTWKKTWENMKNMKKTLEKHEKT